MEISRFGSRRLTANKLHSKRFVFLAAVFNATNGLVCLPVMKIDF